MSDPTLWNHLVDINKAFGVVPVAYAELVNLGTNYMYRRLMIISTLDKPVTLRFTNPLPGGGTSELEIPINSVSPESGYEVVMDEFLHNGIIEYKYTSDPPTEGTLKIVSWRGENV